MTNRLSDIAQALNLALATPDCEFRRVVTDSREVAPGDVFVAIVGENFDGHDFVESAFANGAVAAVVQRPLPGVCLEVPDTLRAYGEIARAHRDRLSARVIGLTGSSGKTSTKDLLAQLLAGFGQTVWAEGSFNNEVGMPATILKATAATEFLVLEMGMRGLGHIAYLCEIARPEIGVLLNVGSAHLELLGSQAAILSAKSELIRALPDTGTAVLYADDPAIAALADSISARSITFGEGATAQVRVHDLRLDDQARPHFTLSYEGETVAVRLQSAGEHQAMNAAAAVAAAVAAGIPFAAAAARLPQLQPLSKWRMQVTELPNGVTLVNDAYNANPESMRAGLKALKAMAHGRRTWAVLGEMRELGDESMTAHDEIGRLCVRLDISRMVGIGTAGKIMQIGAREEGSWGDEAEWVETVDAAIAKLRSEVRPGDIVFVKASRAVGLERVAEALTADSAGENPQP